VLHKSKLAQWKETTTIELFDLLQVNAFNQTLGLDPFDSRIDYFQLQNLILALSPLPLALDRYLELFPPIINTLYRRAQALQLICDQHGYGQVLQPRMGLLQAIASDGVCFNGRELGKKLDHEPEFQFGLVYYKLDLNELLDMPVNEIGGADSITTLELQRSRKYRQMIEEGMRLMQNKSLHEALEKFKKAAQFKVSAEAFNLMAWAYSQLNQPQKAKEHSLKAIQTDADYGPAYNDYGVYLMNEGAHAEALNWFAQAKRAAHYDSREFPFINCGRIYLQQQQYSLALKEFSEAMRLAPQHRQLKDMVAKLARALVRQAQRDVPMDLGPL
jgi:Tfp pilus assembly protein PilF